MKRRLLVAAGVAFSMCLTGCGILPTEEEFDAAPVVKEYEGASFNKVAVTRGTLAKTEEISGKYKGTVKEDIEPDGASVIKKIYVKKGDRVMLVLKRNYQFWLLCNMNCPEVKKH